MAIRGIAILGLMSGLALVPSGATAEALKVELPVVISEVLTSGDAWWVEITFDLTGAGLPTDEVRLQHCQAWIELPLESSAGLFSELDLRMLDEDETVSELLGMPIAMAEGLWKVLVSSPRLYRIELTEAVATGVLEGRMDLRLAAGRLDPESRGEVE